MMTVTHRSLGKHTRRYRQALKRRWRGWQQRKAAMQRYGTPVEALEPRLLLAGDAPVLDWYATLQSDANNLINAVVVDNDHNVYVTGQINAHDSGQPLTDEESTLAFSTGDDAELTAESFGGNAFVAKFNSSGELAWTVTLGGGVLDSSAGTLIDLDEQGNVYIAGQFTGNLSLDGDVDFTSEGDQDVFLISLSADNELRFARQIGSADQDTVTSMHVGQHDDETILLISGQYSDELSIEHTAGTATIAGPGNDNRNSFIAAYNQTGDLDDVLVLQGVSHDAIIHDISSHGQAAAFVGSVQGAADLFLYDFTEQNEPDPEYILTVTGDSAFRSGFVAVQDLDDQSFVGRTAESQSELTHVAFDADDNLYLAGTHVGDMQLGDLTLDGSQNPQAFLFSTDLTLEDIRWGATLTGDVTINDLAGYTESDDNGQESLLLILGQFSGTVDFNPLGDAQTLTAPGNRNGFVLVLDTDGLQDEAFLFAGSDDQDNILGAVPLDDLNDQVPGGGILVGTFLGNVHVNEQIISSDTTSGLIIRLSDQPDEDGVDLTIGDVVFPDTVEIGHAATGSIAFALTNNTTETTESETVDFRVYARPVGAVGSGQDILVGQLINQPVAALDPGASTETFNIDLTLPGSATVGSYRFVVVAAVADEPDDAISAQTDPVFTVFDPFIEPDNVSLSITDIRFPSAVVTGATDRGRLTFDITNVSEERLERGRADARVYARPIDAADNTQDILIGENLNFSIPALQPDRSRSIRVNIELPQGVPAGEYQYVVVTAGVDGLPSETIELVSGDIFVVADPFIDIGATVDESRVRLADSVVSGDGTRLRIPVTLANEGNVAMPNLQIDVQIYAVSVDDPAVRELVHTEQGVNLRNLQPGRDRRVNMNFTLPPGVPDGSYTFEVVVDPANVLDDPNPANNIVRLSDDLAVDVAEGFVDLTVDLDDVRRLDPAVVAGDGSTGRVRVSVTNQGNVNLPRGQQVNVSVYLRPTDATDDSQDILVGSQTANASNLRPDRDRRVNVNVEIPADVAENEYQLVVAVHPTDDLHERNPDNNIQVTDVNLVVAEPFIDLLVGIDEDRVRIPDAVVSGDGTRFRMPVTVQNMGNITLGSQDVLFEIYALPVSEGQIVEDADGVLIETIDTTLRNLRPGQQRRQNLQFVLPPGLPDGDYTFQVQVVTNNDDITANQATLDPALAVNVAEGFVDLSLSLLTPPGEDELEEGETARARVSVGLNNEGNVNMPRQQEVDVRVYLRPADVDDNAQDILIGQQTGRISNLRPDAQRRVNIRVDLDGTEPPDTYRLVLVADPVPHLPEPNTDNNTLIPEGVTIRIVPVDDNGGPDDGSAAEFIALMGELSFTQETFEDLRTPVPGVGNVGIVTGQGSVTSTSDQVGNTYDTVFSSGMDDVQYRTIVLGVLTDNGKVTMNLLFDQESSMPPAALGLSDRTIRFTENRTSDTLGSFVVIDYGTGQGNPAGYFEWVA